MGDGSIGDYQGGGGDASFGDSVGPGVGSVDAGYFSDASSVAADLGFDIGTRGTSTAPDSIDVEQGQTLQGALAQALFDRLSQIDYTTPAGMAQGRFGLDSMAALGLGRTEGLNPNNPTQSVDEMRNAQMVQDVLNYAAPAFASLVPGYGMVSNIGKGIAGIHGLMTGTLSPKDVVPGLAAGLIGARTGIPSGIVEGIITGDLGKTVGSGAQAGLGALVSGITGNPMAGALASSTLGPAVNRAASEAVGGTKSGGPGGLFGGAGVPSTSSAPIGNTYGDAGVNADTYSVLAAIEQAAQEPKQPAWSSQMTAGRYGPLMEYEFGA